MIHRETAPCATRRCAESPALVMNIEHRIATLERLLCDVSRQRRTLLRAAPQPTAADGAVAGLNRLERGFLTALTSVKQQRGSREPFAELTASHRAGRAAR
jgi:hypothetical protein